MDKFRNYFENLINEFFVTFKVLPKEFKREVNFISQLESFEYSSKKEFEKWRFEVCGMACLKMVLNDLNIETGKLDELAIECEKFGGYDLDGMNNGLNYVGFVRFGESNFKLNVELARILSVRRIKNEASKGNYVIVSVNSKIRNPSMSFPRRQESIGGLKRKGGHLVLVVGYDEKFIYVNNPSGIKSISEKSFPVEIDLFKKLFAFRGIIIKNNNYGK